MVTVFYFRNREQAGRQLSLELVGYSSGNPIVLGILRGGIAVAFEVARALNAPLDVFVTHKIGVPGHEELAFGALAEGGGRFIDQDIANSARVTFGETEMVIRSAAAEIVEQAKRYRNGEPLPSLTDRTVILVSDGIASGIEIQAAIASIRQQAPRQLVVATPVISRPTAKILRPLVDNLVASHSAALHYTAGQFYEKYPELEDYQIMNLLKISTNFLHGAEASGAA